LGLDVGFTGGREDDWVEGVEVDGVEVEGELETE
jgi:hypothetical protein